RPATSDVYTLSLHDALPILQGAKTVQGGLHTAEFFEFHLVSRNGGLQVVDRRLKLSQLRLGAVEPGLQLAVRRFEVTELLAHALDRKSTRLNSSHVKISYAV